MIDLGALAAHLDSEPAYNDAIVAGDYAEQHRLLHLPGPAQDFPPRWRQVSRIEFLDAIAGETISDATRDQLVLYISGSSFEDVVPLHQPRISAWLMDGDLSEACKQRLRDLAERAGSPADQFLAFGIDEVGVHDIKRAQRLIGKSRRARYLAEDRSVRSELINRVGRKIASLRAFYLDAGRGTDFMLLRFAGSPRFEGRLSPAVRLQASGWTFSEWDGAAGGIYAQPDDNERERLVDFAMAAEGIPT